jgi:hypothetical protein
MAQFTINMGSNEIFYGPDFQKFATSVNEEQKRLSAREREERELRSQRTAAKGELTPQNVNTGDINEVLAYVRQQFPGSMGSFDASRMPQSNEREDEYEYEDDGEEDCESPSFAAHYSSGTIDNEGWNDHQSEHGKFRVRTTAKVLDNGVLLMAPTKDSQGKGALRLRGTAAASAKSPSTKLPALKTTTTKSKPITSYYPAIPRTLKGNGLTTKTLDQRHPSLPPRRTVKMVKFEEIDD